MDGSAGQGLFYRDMRHLSGFRLEIDSEAPIPRSERDRGSEAEFVLEAGVAGASAWCVGAASGVG